MENTAHPTNAASLESKQAFRADTDQNGDWYVWRRLSASGWATMRRCDSREAAIELAETLNRDADKFTL